MGGRLLTVGVNIEAILHESPAIAADRRTESDMAEWHVACYLLLR